MRIAMLQIAPSADGAEANAVIGERACRAAANRGADLAIFPEMWSHGYAPFADEPGDRWRAPGSWADGEREGDRVAAARADWQKSALPSDGHFVQRFHELGAELEMAIAITYLEAWPVRPRNTVALIDRRGDTILTYAKVHTCAFGVFEDALTPGDGFRVATLEVAEGPVEIGAMICYDREFPESARTMMLAGAEVIIVPNACELEINRLAQTRSRAFENMTAIALVNYPPPVANGRSVLFDGMAVDDHGQSHDMTVAEAGDAEEIVVADLDLAALREYRAREVWGGAFRRPEMYASLTSSGVQPPFVRVDCEGKVWGAG